MCWLPTLGGGSKPAGREMPASTSPPLAQGQDVWPLHGGGLSMQWVMEEDKECRWGSVLFPHNSKWAIKNTMTGRKGNHGRKKKALYPNTFNGIYFLLSEQFFIFHFILAHRLCSWSWRRGWGTRGEAVEASAGSPLSGVLEARG